MHIDFLLDKFRDHLQDEAFIWQNQSYSYQQFLDDINDDIFFLETKIEQPLVVSLEGDFSPHAAALLLALIELNCIVVPLTSAVDDQKEEFLQIAEIEAQIFLNPDDTYTYVRTGSRASHPLLKELKAKGHPGLVLFSPSSAGKSKAAVHDFLPLLEKFKVPKKTMRMMPFLLFNHIGGINTLLYVLSNAGCLITVPSRQPKEVCQAIEQYKVEVLPTAPSFLQSLLLSEVYKHYDLSSLKVITYGTEPMSETLLLNVAKVFPNVMLQQTYGLREIGILRSKSKSSKSIWVKLGGEDFQTRVVDGVLEIKAKSAMLGYLNAPSPFTKDGWFQTGDAVEVDGEYFKILGRQNDVINIDGHRVSPSDVEDVLMQMDFVEDVAVHGETNLLVGQLVKAVVKLAPECTDTASQFKKRMREFCQDKLQPFEIPQKIQLAAPGFNSVRFKKMHRYI